MDNIFIVVIFITLSLLIFILLREIKKLKKAKPKHKLDKQLLIMLNGDKKAALRLLRHARQKNPGQTYLWYHEKVIRDLERDRGY